MRLDPPGIPLRARKRRPARARSLLAVGAALGMLAAVAGCSASGGAGGTVSSTITIAAVPGIDDAPLYIAQQDGLFSAAGLQHVRIRTYSSDATALQALQSHQADIAITDYGSIFYDQSKYSLKILADGYDASSGVLEILTLPGSKITSPTQLTGAKVKVGLPNNDLLPNQTHYPSLDAAAATDVLTTYVGNNADSVNWISMSPQQELYDLQHHAHGISAILVGQPYIYEAEQDFGAVALMDACSGATANLPLDGYVATSAWVKGNSAAVADFQSAISQAEADATQAGLVQKALPKAVSGITTEAADLATIGNFPTTTNASELGRVQTLLLRDHVVSSTVSVFAMVAG